MKTETNLDLDSAGKVLRELVHDFDLDSEFAIVLSGKDGKFICPGVFGEHVYSVSLLTNGDDWNTLERLQEILDARRAEQEAEDAEYEESYHGPN